MVEAISTPGYEPPFDATKIILKRLHGLEDEARREYYKREGLVRWCVNEGDGDEFPLRSWKDTLLWKNTEYRNPSESPRQYIYRTIRKGAPRKLSRQIYVVHGRIGLNLEISHTAIEPLEPNINENILITTLFLTYRGWRDRSRVPFGEVYRKPDFVQFSETIFDLGFIAALSYSGKD